ncbi:sugar ABC transporter ATP-binding protein [Thermoflexus sp.]|uniref:sugar ABC transporter ATP-binding protein n=1 Tax=Thermoflexus sp. TaxID=1969742 RepID=UPI002603AFE3|nr:sugar ABC transporter ATP-binding protein [Thermoflexus sp.]MCX7690649.1 sugar ABC transporter ATP-binding protein [Thermoflexus sp.]MDW8065823.1 sugar ABC transporter ATP-binding protein [Anaerolineae bacterium]
MSGQNLILRVEGVSKAFPGVQALSNVDLELAAGEVLALVGENGAGKSTLMKILSGAYRKDAGRIFINGQEVEIAGPRHAQELGIAIIYQEFNLAPNLSAAANIFLGREPRRPGIGRLFVDRKRMEQEAQKLLDRIGARIPASALVRDLSVAERQMVEIAKALAVNARIIIMDEPTSALGEEEVEKLFQVIRTLKQQGIGIIFITHRLEEVFRIADRIVVLRDGKRVGSMPTYKATRDEVIRLMVGRELGDLFQKQKSEIGPPLLEVRGLTRRGVVENVSFTLHRGEILGLAGLVGAGRTETVRMIFGADPKDAGEILIEGKPVKIESPRDAMKAGIGFVPEDRSNHGLILSLSVLENIALPSLSQYTRLGIWLNRMKLYKTAREFVDKLSIRVAHLQQKVMFLSGGNQQKVVVAKWLALRPRILIMDEPTRGIDVGAKAEIHALMNRLAQEGVGIIMVSSELPEILGMSDRILVMARGRVMAVLSREEATQELIMAYASGEKIAQMPDGPSQAA